MSRHRLKSISGSTFRSLRSPFSVDFPENGLLLLNGWNLDTGGSSGSGKTSLVLAIQDGLGICPVPRTELGSWMDGAKAVPTTQLVLDIDGKDVVIDRGKKFELTVNGTPITGGAPQKEEELTKQLGLSPEMVKALTYRGQREPGLFLNKTDAEKKDFLTQLLGLDKFEAAQEVSAAKLKELETKLTAARAVRDRVAQSLAELAPPETSKEQAQEALAAAEASLAETERKIAEIAEELKSFDAANAGNRAQAVFDPELAAAEAAHEELLAARVPFAADTTELTRLSGLGAQCQERLQRLTKEDADKQKTVNAEVARIQAEIANANRTAGTLGGLRREETRLNSEFDKLNASVCPTCDRLWDEAGARKEAIIQELKSLEPQIEAATRARDAIQGLRDEQERARASFMANPMIERLRDAKSKNDQAVAAERQRLESAKKVYESEASKKVAEAAGRVAEIRRQHAAADAEIARARAARRAEIATRLQAATAGKVVELSAKGFARDSLAAIERYEAQKTKLQGQVDQETAVVTDLEVQVAAERDFQHLIGREGFLGGIFDEVLAEISEETSATLAAVANTRGCTFRFRSESVTQKGTTKRAIVPVVSVNGFESTSLKSALSGGMLSTVELAVDLAVGAVIARRSGITPGWLILDESFDGLDPISKESCLEILQKYAQDRLVIVIDHMSETKGLFTQRLLVEYRGGESRIAQ